MLTSSVDSAIPMNKKNLKFGFLFILMFAVCVILLPLAVYGDGRLDVYRNLIGSPFERIVIRYARDCLISELDHGEGKPQLAPELGDLPPTGLYMSLMDGRRVRACMGSFSPFSSNIENALIRLAEEVIYGDTRTRPLSLSEIDGLSIVLSFVGPLKEISDPYSIDFTREGLYISQEGRGGVLLPGETKTLEYGISRLLREARLDPNRACRYASFDVVAFDERRK